MAKGATIISVIVADQCTRSDFQSFHDGLEWVFTDAQNNPGRRAVVNASYVFSPMNGDDANFHAAIQSLVQANVPVVVAAGNASADASSYVPAGYPEVITVGGTDMSDSRWVDSTITPGNENAGSNFGQAVSLFAPAVNIPGADDTSDTASGFGTGTSAGAPLVAGIVARYLEAVPSATPSGVRAALLQFATPNVVQNAGAGSGTSMAYVGFVDDIVNSGGGGPGCPGTSNTLCPGQVLPPNGAFGSPHGVYFLVYQLDGNLVEYNTNGFQAGGGAVWASNTAGTHPGSVVMSPSGSLQIFDAGGNLIYQSSTAQPGAYLSLADTGNLSILASNGSPLWSNNVNGGGGGSSCPGSSNMLCPGQTLGQNQAFGSPSGIYFLAMQGSGDLEEFNTSEFQAGDGPVWTSNTGGSNPGWAEMQTDGDFVVFDGSGNQLWHTGTSGNSGAYLVLNDDGSLVVVANDGVTVIAVVYQGGGEAP